LIHPAFIALAKKPGLLLEHADAYSDLASAELDEWAARWKRQAVIGVAAAVLLALGLLLAGTAGLFVAAIPLHNMPLPWLLWAIPGVPLVIGLGLAWAALATEKPAPFTALRQQVAQDLATLKLLDEE
jgi:cytochrome bd-type quinol oxidase subunit 2